ncbi:hypothetical protein RJT34_01935 [Clitoria ternatea]|uniref:Uncharacterized protein n=1 Tax=Clitoria ternatea TaxID=43366 RepID=A0AAN9KI52_CLITE
MVDKGGIGLEVKMEVTSWPVAISGYLLLHLQAIGSGFGDCQVQRRSGSLFGSYSIGLFVLMENWQLMRAMAVVHALRDCGHSNEEERILSSLVENVRSLLNHAWKVFLYPIYREGDHLTHWLFAI